MGDVITALTTALTPAVLWGNITALVPLLVVLIPFALGLYFLRKAIKGAGKGKARF